MGRGRTPGAPGYEPPVRGTCQAPQDDRGTEDLQEVATQLRDLRINTHAHYHIVLSKREAGTARCSPNPPPGHSVSKSLCRSTPGRKLSGAFGWISPALVPED